VHLAEDRVPLKWSTVVAADVVMETRFFNPYNRLEHRWDYGLFFRSTTEQGFRLIIRDDGAWFVSYTDHRRGVIEQTTVQSGTISLFDKAPGGSNHIRLVVLGEEGLFFVNANFVATLDLRKTVNSGKAGVASGIFKYFQWPGNATKYEKFRVRAVSP
jgi:hypothetical protein